MREPRKPIRHGDVILLPCESIPAEATPKANNHLAEGEKTGHYHAALNGEVLEHEGELMLRALENTTLTHQEHNTLVVPQGLYRVIIQREYDDTNEWRQVKD